MILLTKAHAATAAKRCERQAAALQRWLVVLTLDPCAGDAVGRLAPWCGSGRTVALVGSSGVGKSTLVKTLAGPEDAPPQLTGPIRERDAEGRHTTTVRSLHRIAAGGWVIDTPGMRMLNVSDAVFGLGTLFAEIVELAPARRFSDCTHLHEPGCAVQAAVRDGRLDADRVARWRRLTEENRANTPAATGPRGDRVTAGRARRR